MPSLSLAEVDLRVVHVRTRLPFRYGIVRMTEAEHIIARVRLPGADEWGLAAESLVPKWFTKDPSSTLADDLAAMKLCVRHAAAMATQITASTPFSWWQELHRRQSAWGVRRGLPGLLLGLGTSLLERAMLDAVCRTEGITFGTAARDGTFGLDLGALHPELSGRSAGVFLPARPAQMIRIRHTVGLGDQIRGAADTGDGLPVTVEEAIDAYGIDHLKVKTRGDVGDDAARLAEVRRLAEDRGLVLRLTIDGNESFRTPADFIAWWNELSRNPRVDDFLAQALIAIEQPLHRGVALDPAVAGFQRELSGSPLIIIDESDAGPSSVRRGMDLGYAGGTYKGCKGVFRGVANACLIAARSEERATLLTAEDLTTLPPFTLLQDFAVAASLGLEHIERNGHHFFGTAAPVSPDVHQRLHQAHGDLFTLQDGRSRLRICDGAVSLQSVLAAPFGLLPVLDVSESGTVEEWSDVQSDDSSTASRSDSIAAS